MNHVTKDDQNAYDLRVSAYHEAGHKVMYRRFGGDGDAIVWKNLSDKPDEMAWRGQFRPRTDPQIMHDLAKKHGLLAVNLPENWHVIFGMAGLVAEEILRGETDPEFVEGALYIKIVGGEVSASDLTSMGITNIDDFGLNTEEVETALQYLIQDWPYVQKEAENLIVDALTK